MMTAFRTALSLLLLLTGCTGGHGSPDHRAQLEALVGASRQQLEQRFGPPTRESSAEDQSFLTWDELQLTYVNVTAGYRYDNGALFGGSTRQPAAARFDCRTTFVLLRNRVTAYNLSGVGCS